MPSRRSMLMISEGEFNERGKKVRVPFLVGWSWIFKNSCLDGTPAHITCSLPVYWDAAELTSTDPVVRHPTWYNNEHVMVSSALFSNVSESLSPPFSHAANHYVLQIWKDCNMALHYARAPSFSCRGSPS